MKNQFGQSLLELVVGVGILAIISGAVVIVVFLSLRNSQFSQNQLRATNLAKQNMERVKAIKNENRGVCLQNQVSEDPPICSPWEDLWAIDFGTFNGACSGNCFEIISPCTITGDVQKNLCLSYKATEVAVGGNLYSQIILEDEGDGDTEKKVTSRVSWNDTTGNHTSELVTVLSKR